MITLNEQIQRLRDVLVTCYNAIKRKGGTIPEAGERNMSNLPDAVRSIPQEHTELVELEVTANGEYLPATYDADGFSKVTARFDTSSLPKVKVSMFRVTNDCIDENGRWEGEYLIDTSNCNSFQDCFISCDKIKRIDVNLETSNSNSFYRTFNNTGLQYINTSLWDTSKATNMQEMFVLSKYLVEIDTKNWDVSNVTNTHNMFGHCYRLQSLIGNTTLENVLMNNISAFNGLKVALALNYGPVLDTASILALVNGLADLTNQTSKTLTLGSTIGAKLDTEQIAGVPAKEYLAGIANNKNWTIAY